MFPVLHSYVQQQLPLQLLQRLQLPRQQPLQQQQPSRVVR